MVEEETYSIPEISSLTGLEPVEILRYIREGGLRAELVQTVTGPGYRITRSALLEHPVIGEALRERGWQKEKELTQSIATESATLMELVDRYKALLDEIAHYKMRAAILGGGASKRQELKGELDRKSKEIEEMERELVELRGRIHSKELEIKKLQGLL
jgi:hypothetical protein